MAKKQVMQGNEALAESALRAGCRFFAGYPITPQTEITEYLAGKMNDMPGRAFVQGESEVASINMVFGASMGGARAMTATSSQGLALMAEGLSLLAGQGVPAVVVDVCRGGPGNCNTEASQMNYNFITKSVGHGGFRAFCLAPSTVQETADMVYDAFDIADKYRCLVYIMTDGMLGHLIESVELKPYRDLNELPPRDYCPRGNECGHTTRAGRPPLEGEAWAKHHAEMCEAWGREECRWEEFMADDADTLVIAWGTVARIAKTAIRKLRKEGHKVGMIRPQTLYPFPEQVIANIDDARVKNILVMENSVPAQFYYDVKAALAGKQIPLHLFTHSMGIQISGEEAEEQLRKLL